MKSLIISICVLLFTSAAWAAPPPAPPAKAVIIGGGADNLLDFSNSFYVYMGPFYTRGDTDIHDVEQVMPVGGKLSHLYVNLHDDAGGTNASQDWQFSVIINGDTSDVNFPEGITSLSCTISGQPLGFPPNDLAESCSNIVDTVSISAGDKLAIIAKPSCKNSSDTCPEKREVRWTLLLEPGPH
jgi:hypothetical protein